eukprot:gene12480-14648_t
MTSADQIPPKVNGLEIVDLPNYAPHWKLDILNGGNFTPPLRASWDTKSTPNPAYLADVVYIPAFCLGGVWLPQGGMPSSFQSLPDPMPAPVDPAYPNVLVVLEESFYSYIGGPLYDFVCIFGTFDATQAGFKASGYFVAPQGRLIIDPSVPFLPAPDYFAKVDPFRYFPGVLSMGRVGVPDEIARPFDKSLGTVVNSTHILLPGKRDDGLSMARVMFNQDKVVGGTYIQRDNQTLIETSEPIPAGSTQLYVWTDLNGNRNIIPVIYTAIARGTITLRAYGFMVSSTIVNGPYTDVPYKLGASIVMGSNPRNRAPFNALYGGTISVYDTELMYDTATMNPRVMFNALHGTLFLNNSVLFTSGGSLISASYGTEYVNSTFNLFVHRPRGTPVPENPAIMDVCTAGSVICSISPDVISENDTFVGFFPGGAYRYIEIPSRPSVTGMAYDYSIMTKLYRATNQPPFSLAPLNVNPVSIEPDSTLLFFAGQPNGQAYILQLALQSLSNPITLQTSATLLLESLDINTPSLGPLISGSASIAIRKSTVRGTMPLLGGSFPSLSVFETIFANGTTIGGQYQGVSPYAPILVPGSSSPLIIARTIPSDPHFMQFNTSVELGAVFTGSPLSQVTCKFSIGSTEVGSAPLNVASLTCSTTVKIIVNGTVLPRVTLVDGASVVILTVELPSITIADSTFSPFASYQLSSETNINANGMQFTPCNAASQCELVNAVRVPLQANVPPLPLEPITPLLLGGAHQIDTTLPASLLLTLPRGYYVATLYFSWAQYTEANGVPFPSFFSASTPNGGTSISNPLGPDTQVVSSVTISFVQLTNTSIPLQWSAHPSAYMVGATISKATLILPIDPPSAPASSNNLVKIIVPIVVGLALIATILAVFLVRRHRANKPSKSRKVDVEMKASGGKLGNSGGGNPNSILSSQSSPRGPQGILNNSGNISPLASPLSASRTALKSSTGTASIISADKYRLHADVFSFVQESHFYAPDHADFPLTFSTARLDFGMGGMKCPIDTALIDSLTIVNKSRNQVTVNIILPPSCGSSLIESDAPTPLIIKPGKPVTIAFGVRLLCTTKLMEKFAVHVQDFGHTFLYMHLESVLSTQLDFDELVFFEPPIGEGSFGIVYRGQWRGQDVAIKKLKITHLSSELVADVYREMDLMNKLRHPNIVSFVGAVKTSDKLCLVSEFISMGSLASVLYKERRTLTLREKVRIALDTAKGCNFLHQCGIMHRDLKPDNILVVSLSADAPVTVKLTDFGTSKEVTEFDISSYTSGIGTPIYMANEILERKSYDNSADVYSYAIMFYELILGEVPFSDFKNVW